MSLHDVDKSTNSRLNPAPNVSDGIPTEFRMAHGTTNFTLVNEDTGEVVKLVIKDSTIKVVDMDATNNVQIGNLPNNRGGFASSKPGNSVTDGYS